MMSRWPARWACRVRPQGQQARKGKARARRARRADGVRRRRRCAVRSAPGGMPGGLPRPVAACRKGLDELPPGPGRHRPVEAEVPGQELGCACARLHVRGRVLPDDEPRRVVDRRRRAERRAGGRRRDGFVRRRAGSCPAWSTPTATSGSAAHGATDLDEAIGQAETERGVGALLLRDAGSPVDTRSLDDRDDLPRIIRAGRHIAPAQALHRRACRSTSRTSRSCPTPSPSRPGSATAGSSSSATGSTAGSATWRRCGPTTILKAAIDAAHANGARVTAHVFGEDALPGLINAGIDCIEHGTGITDDAIA